MYILKGNMGTDGRTDTTFFIQLHFGQRTHKHKSERLWTARAGGIVGQLLLAEPKFLSYNKEGLGKLSHEHGRQMWDRVILKSCGKKTTTEVWPRINTFKYPLHWCGNTAWVSYVRV